ncbi:16S rRNA (guanine(966)-N(2))-methyltransferase RsmD [Brassicibacter mesophilus]|uniref:16S rRNA (guanine(966)-N(2))-methyltransferase RsmD n=1 Tax=Brassicibacter mesophilus TaxID=745119 RepID=UPI003D1AE70B
MLRVITGKLKGHKLKAPKGMSTRPTADRVKESIFNIIGYIPENSTVLDLFAGSGNIGIEFLSRGASRCYFIDNSHVSTSIIKENLEATNLSNQAQIYKNYVDRALTILGSKNICFDFIFMDPPYEKDLVAPTIEALYINRLLDEEGIVIIEHETKASLEEEYLGLIRYDARKYGGTTVSFYKHKEV